MGACGCRAKTSPRIRLMRTMETSSSSSMQSTWTSRARNGIRSSIDGTQGTPRSTSSSGTVFTEPTDMRTALRRFPGGLKQRTAQEQFAKDPSSILREAVLGMLPKNNLRKVSVQAPARVPLISQQQLGSCTRAFVYFFHILPSIGRLEHSCFAGSRPEVEDIPVLRPSFPGSPAAHRLGAGAAEVAHQGAAVRAARGLGANEPRGKPSPADGCLDDACRLAQGATLSPSIWSPTDHHIWCAGVHEALRA